MELGKPREGNIVIGRHVTPEKRLVARGLRRRMTPEEKRLWHWLRDSRLGIHFRRQQIIDGFIADFYCHQALLVVEADSPSHDREYDVERDRVFNARDILVLRFKNEEINGNLPSVLNRVRQAIKNRLNDSGLQ